MAKTPIQAIRAKCVDCCAGHYKEIAICRAVNCPLYPYRMGKRPRVGIVTPEDHMEFSTPESPQFFATEVKNEDPLV